MATQSTIQAPRVVSREQWVTERAALLAKEKEFTQLSDELSRQRRELPWVGSRSRTRSTGRRRRDGLADLFQGRSQLIVYHFMYGPDMKEACTELLVRGRQLRRPPCRTSARGTWRSRWSRGRPIRKLEAFKRRMGWQLPLGLVLRHRLQLRLRRLVRPSSSGKPGLQLYNYGTSEVLLPEREGASVFAAAGRRDLPHLLDLRARAWRR